MKLNESTDHAIRLMLLLAKNNGRLPSSEIAEKENLSRRYLFRITAKLRDAGLLTVLMGPAGGYALAHDSSQISLHDIIQAMEGPLQLPEHATLESKENALGTVYCYFRDFFCRYTQMITLDVLATYSNIELKKLTTDFVADEKVQHFI